MYRSGYTAGRHLLADDKPDCRGTLCANAKIGYANAAYRYCGADAGYLYSAGYNLPAGID